MRFLRAAAGSVSNAIGWFGFCIFHANMFPRDWLSAQHDTSQIHSGCCLPSSFFLVVIPAVPGFEPYTVIICVCLLCVHVSVHAYTCAYVCVCICVSMYVYTFRASQDARLLLYRITVSLASLWLSFTVF